MRNMQDMLVKQFNKETVTKVIERLIKNEKWNCRILVSLIILMVKHNSSDNTGQDSTLKDLGNALIKKILKKKVWEALKSSKQIDLWDCIKQGLVIYFSLFQSRDNYRMLKDNVPSEIRDEMGKDQHKGHDFKQFIDTYSRR